MGDTRRDKPGASLSLLLDSVVARVPDGAAGQKKKDRENGKATSKYGTAEPYNPTGHFLESSDPTPT